ncbi:MAG: MlaD family protein [bacterium]
MARRLSWSDVRGGLFATCAIVVAIVATLKYSRVGQLHGDTITLYAHVGEARGVLVGSEVWLSGQKIGRISDIRFRPPSVADTSSRIEIVMEVLARYREAMHRDAQAQIRAGGTIIGQQVVYISPGTVASTAIADRDTIATRSQGDVEGSGGKFELATRELPAIVGNVKEIVTQLRTSQGTVGAMVNAPGGPGGADMRRALGQANRLRARISGREALGYVADGGLIDRAQLALARVDSLQTLLSSSGTSYGRLRKDTTLRTNVQDIQHQLSTVRSELDAPIGTVGMARHDSTLSSSIMNAHHQLTILLADMKKHPLRYISF